MLFCYKIRFRKIYRNFHFSDISSRSMPIATINFFKRTVENKRTQSSGHTSFDKSKLNAIFPSMETGRGPALGYGFSVAR